MLEIMNLHYLGPEGSFSEEAAHFLKSGYPLIPHSTIEEVLHGVKTGEAAVVPVENSLEGGVLRTLDAILKSTLRVVAEINLPIEQHLLTKETDLKTIATIYSHPQAIGQVKNW